MSFQDCSFYSVFVPTEVVELRQVCFTPNAVFEPGVYYAGQLPRIAFELGLVERKKGKAADIRSAKSPEDPVDAPDVIEE